MRGLHLTVLAGAGALGLHGAAAAAPLTRTQPALTEAGARSILEAAEQLSAGAKDPAALAVVDSDGRLMAFVRMDEARPGSVDLALGKARSAALMRRPTEELEENVAAGRTALATSGLTALRGGAPIWVDGVVIGAVGVAGLKKEDDERTATAISAKFGPGPNVEP